MGARESPTLPLGGGFLVGLSPGWGAKPAPREGVLLLSRGVASLPLRPEVFGPSVYARAHYQSRTEVAFLHGCAVPSVLAYQMYTNRQPVEGSCWPAS